MELPKRKPTRLKEYDYSAPGAYFITICTHNKEEILSSKIVGEGFAPPENELTIWRLSKIGEIIIERRKSIEVSCIFI